MFAGMSKLIRLFTNMIVVLPPLPLKLLQLASGIFAILRISSHVVVWKSTAHKHISTGQGVGKSALEAGWIVGLSQYTN